MAIVFLPEKVLKQVAPKKAVERLVTGRLTLNRAALNMLARQDVIGKKSLEKVALKVIKGYKKSYGEYRDEGVSKTESLEQTLNGKRLMVQRVQNAVVWEMSQELQELYAGEKYEWLPSDAEEPDPEHQLNYGQIFTLGEGEAPGDREGCKCGMRILVDEVEST